MPSTNRSIFCSIKRSAKQAIFSSVIIVPLVLYSTFSSAETITIGAQNQPDLYLLLKRLDWRQLTGDNVKWKFFSNGVTLLSALRAGTVQIAYEGSVPFAAAASKGMPFKMFWINDAAGNSEELVVRKGIGINNPQQLEGKTVGVVVGSTSWLSLLATLKKYNIPDGSVNIENLSPGQILAAWKTKRIDAAFIWPPVLPLIKGSGRVLLSSKQLCDKDGVCTFTTMIVNRDWAQSNKKFLDLFTKNLIGVTNSYKVNKTSYTVTSSPVLYISKLTGSTPHQVVSILASYDYLTTSQELSAQWLGGGAGDYLKLSSQYLKKIGVINTVLPSYGNAMTKSYIEEALQK